jgi:DNA-directed RNA polymerase subunit RPC12/RpoP
MSLKIQQARKEYRCDSCGKKIPIGERYWRDFEENTRDFCEHTNCLSFVRPMNQPTKVFNNPVAWCHLLD